MPQPVCELCEREVPRLTEHHLIPRSVGRRKGKKSHELPTADLCSACHRQLHVLFDNRELATKLSDLNSLRAEASVAKFLLWVRKQPSERAIRVRR